ncbi:MAG: NADH:flavin oxidoreductase [Deltaproteobacteria bacterium]|nr:NADH:flavin oxidoreductase [Deltaproteobacteria bacterium]
MTSPLLEPLRFRNGATAPNRIWLAPLTNLQSHADGVVSDDEARWLASRADGGFGIVESAATHVSADGQAWNGQLAASDDRFTEGWQRLSKETQAKGAPLLAQLFHGGARALPFEGRAPWSASPSLEGEPAFTEATVAQIEQVLADFIAAALRIERAGGAGVELHGAHGYLLCQFLSSTMNRRTDGWGGTLENRARLLREAMQGIRAVVKPGFIVGVRLSPENFGSLTGLDLDESLQVAKWLADDGADFIHISLWNAANMTLKRPSEHPVPLFVKALPADLPVISAGGIWTREEAEAQLTLGASAVALGRSAILNADWPTRVASAGEEPRRTPTTAAYLRASGLGEAFVNYLAARPGFMA